MGINFNADGDLCHLTVDPAMDSDAGFDVGVAPVTITGQLVVEPSNVVNEEERAFQEVMADKIASGETNLEIDFGSSACGTGHDIYDEHIDLDPHPMRAEFISSSENTAGAQIDSVMVTPQGLVFIEMKNYIGCVKGHKQDRQWLYTDPNGNTKTFFNPIQQNFGHLAAVRNTVKQKFHKLPVWGLIAFGDKCKLNELSSIEQGIGEGSYLY